MTKEDFEALIYIRDAFKLNYLTLARVLRVDKKNLYKKIHDRTYDRELEIDYVRLACIEKAALMFCERFSKKDIHTVLTAQNIDEDSILKCLCSDTVNLNKIRLLIKSLDRLFNKHIEQYLNLNIVIYNKREVKK